MIWIMLGILLLSGSATSNFTRQLEADYRRAEQVLADSPQRQPALEQLAAMRDISRKSFKASSKLLSRGVKLGRDHELPSDAIANDLQDQVATVEILDRQFLDARDRLHALLTRDQWVAIFGGATTETR